LSRSLLLVVAVLLALPASAQAAFDVPAFSVTPTGLQAGSHPDVSVALQFNGDEHVRDLTLSLPPGLVGNPNATARCSASAFAADECPATTRIGTTSVVTRIALLSVLPITAEGDVYNLRPAAGEPARLGVVVRPPLGAEKVFIVSRVALRPSDGGLDSIITGLPSTIGTPLGDLDMRIESMNLTLLGRPEGAKQPFMTMPTSCRAATARVVARSDAGTAVSRAAPPFTPTACGRLPFKPQLQASMSNDPLPAIRTVITGPPGNANTAAAAVTLPSGLLVNTDALANVCTFAQQAAGPCPPTARVGSALVRSPLLPPLTGSVFLAEVPGQNLPGVRVDLAGVVKLSLAGIVDTNPRLRTRFAGLPDVPLERFELTFNANGALRAGPDFCRGPLPRIDADLTGQNGAKANLRVPVTVTGCAKPVARLRVHGRRLRLRVNAARGGPALDRVRLNLPKRLKVHPRRGRVTRGATLTRRALKIPGRGARTITATLSRGAFTGKLGKKRKFVLVTRDVSGRTVRQKLRARR
jgi:hypothetical protein